MLATGDLFRRDEDGFLHWVGRTDDLIKCRGEKVYPREVEEVLHAVDGVREAAVVGVADRLLGQAVTPTSRPSRARSSTRRRCGAPAPSSSRTTRSRKRVVVHEELPRNAARQDRPRRTPRRERGRPRLSRRRRG